MPCVGKKELKQRHVSISDSNVFISLLFQASQPLPRASGTAPLVCPVERVLASSCSINNHHHQVLCPLLHPPQQKHSERDTSTYLAKHSVLLTRVMLAGVGPKGALQTAEIVMVKFVGTQLQCLVCHLRAMVLSHV